MCGDTGWEVSARGEPNVLVQSFTHATSPSYQQLPLLLWTRSGNVLTASLVSVQLVSDKRHAYGQSASPAVGCAACLRSAANRSGPAAMPRPLGAGLPPWARLSPVLLLYLSEYWTTARSCTDGRVQRGRTAPLQALSSPGRFIRKLSTDSNTLQSQQELANSSESDSKSSKQHGLPAQPSCEGVNLLLILLRLSATCRLVRSSAVTTKNVAISKILLALLLTITAVSIHDTQNKLDFTSAFKQFGVLF